jgi:hypothetical protein
MRFDPHVGANVRAKCQSGDRALAFRASPRIVRRRGVPTSHKPAQAGRVYTGKVGTNQYTEGSDIVTTLKPERVYTGGGSRFQYPLIMSKRVMPGNTGHSGYRRICGPVADLSGPEKSVTVRP